MTRMEYGKPSFWAMQGAIAAVLHDIKRFRLNDSSFQKFMDGVNRFIVDLGQNLPNMVGNHCGRFFDNGVCRGLYAHLQFFGNRGDGVFGLLTAAETCDSLHDHGVRGRRMRPAKGGGRSFPLRSDRNTVSFDSDDAVSADADGFRVKTANQCFTSVYGNAERFQEGNAVCENGYVRRRTADVQGNASSLREAFARPP